MDEFYLYLSVFWWHWWPFLPMLAFFGIGEAWLLNRPSVDEQPEMIPVRKRHCAVGPIRWTGIRVS
jgi:hypothetical protein